LDDLVRRDLLAVAGPADHDAETARVGHDGLPGGDAEGRVVVLWVEGRRPVVHNLVAGGGQVFLEVLDQVESGVVAAQVYAHGAHPGIAQSKAGRSLRVRLSS
jgi:hypothetical protein